MNKCSAQIVHSSSKFNLSRRQPSQKQTQALTLASQLKTNHFDTQGLANFIYQINRGLIKAVLQSKNIMHSYLVEG